MKPFCVVVGLMTFTTLAACTEDVIVMVLVNEGLQTCKSTRRIFLVTGIMDSTAQTIGFTNSAVYELGGGRSISNAPAGYDSLHSLLQLYNGGQRLVEFCFIYGILTNPQTYQHDSSSDWQDIYNPTAISPTGNFIYVIHYDN